MARAAIVAFVASFCTLVIEISAGRILAPLVGVSLYTWTSIIGVVLAGISLGAWAGGRLADRRPHPSTLGHLLLLAAGTAVLIVPLTEFLGNEDGPLGAVAPTLLSRVVILALLLFFPPSLFLGMISPVTVKLAVRDLDTTGSVVGRLYAISTVGSIAGTFATGFWLIASFGTRTTLAGVGVTLLLTALLFGGLFSKRTRAIAAGAVVGSVIAVALRPAPVVPPYQVPLLEPGATGIVHDEESQYYRIRVERMINDDTGGPLFSLHLDHLVHSYSDPADPSHLHYEYLQIFDAVSRRTEGRTEAPRILFVGGGGYTLPGVIARRNRRATVDVVEIDPAVTRVARRWFGLQTSANLRPIHEDARWYAMRSRERYDLIFVDAFNDLSVPYHLTTLEAGLDFRRLLRPGGAIVANVVDDFARGRFLASYVRTMQEVFPEGGAAVVIVEHDDLRSRRSTFVTVASDVLGLHLPGSYENVAGARLERWLTDRRALLLTDDHAPVDNMLAPLFEDRFLEEERQ